MDQSLDKKSISDKHENLQTVIRVVHNRENPFVQINRKALWDERLSLKATGLWARCLSMPSDWKFSMKDLIKHCKEGKLAVYSAMQELIEFGYVARFEISDRTNGKFKGSRLEYVFFEFAATEEEIAEQFEIFKKSLPHTENRDTGNRDTGNQPLLIIKTLTEKKDLPKENTTPPIPPHSGSDDPVPAKAGVVRDFPEEVIQTAKAMKEAMAEAKPDSKAPVAQKLLTSIDLMIRVDKRDAGRIMRVFRWALSDEFWKDKFFKPDPAKYLREKFDQLEAKMTAKPSSFSKADRRARDSNGNPIKDEILDNLF